MIINRFQLSQASIHEPLKMVATHFVANELSTLFQMIKDILYIGQCDLDLCYFLFLSMLLIYFDATLLETIQPHKALFITATPIVTTG